MSMCSICVAPAVCSDLIRWGASIRNLVAQVALGEIRINLFFLAAATWNLAARSGSSWPVSSVSSCISFRFNRSPLSRVVRKWHHAYAAYAEPVMRTRLNEPGQAWSRC